MFINNMTNTCPIWILWYTFEHHGRGTASKWCIHYISMTRYPAHISSTPEDVIFFDIKSMNDEKHKRYTGKSNQIILDNFKQLVQDAKTTKITARTPVIPGFNDTVEELEEIQRFVAKGKNGAIAVLAIAPKGCLLHAPDMYMQKICVGPRAKGRIDIRASVTENLKNVADAMGREVSDLTMVILDRERHEKIIREAREAGARVYLITDGDVVPSVDCGIQGSGIHMVMGSGGAPEGVLSAVGLKCLGGDMQARLLPQTEQEIQRLHTMGIDDPNKVLTLDDLVKGDDCIFAETAITDCAMLRGVRFFGGGARTSTLVLRYKTGTVRFIDTVHRFGEDKPGVRMF